MTTQTPTTDEPQITAAQQRCIDAYEAADGNSRKAAEALAMNERSFRRGLARAYQAGWRDDRYTPAGAAAPKPTITTMPIDRLIVDEDLQPRVQLDDSTIEEYAAIYRDHGPTGMDPVRAYRVLCEESAILTRGFTRLEAARQVGLTELPVELMPPTPDRRALLLDSLGGNRHGLRLTTADKRRALHLYHESTEESEWEPTRAVAHLIGCSHDLVAAYRREIAGDIREDEPERGPDQIVYGSGVPLSEIQDQVDRLVPRLLDDLEEHGLLTISEREAAALMTICLTTRIPDEYFDDGGPISLEQIERVIGFRPNVVKLVDVGWIAGDDDRGYTITGTGNSVCRLSESDSSPAADTTELIMRVVVESDGGWYAHTDDGSCEYICSQGDADDDMQEMIDDAVQVHFAGREVPPVRLVVVSATDDPPNDDEDLFRPAKPDEAAETKPLAARQAIARQDQTVCIAHTIANAIEQDKALRLWSGSLYDACRLALCVGIDPQSCLWQDLRGLRDQLIVDHLVEAVTDSLLVMLRDVPSMAPDLERVCELYRLPFSSYKDCAVSEHPIPEA